MSSEKLKKLSDIELFLLVSKHLEVIDLEKEDIVQIRKELKILKKNLRKRKRKAFIKKIKKVYIKRHE